MATILLKKREGAGAPVAGDLTNASGGTEVAINLEDARIYTKNSAGSIIELATNPGELNLGGKVSETVDIRLVGASGTINIDWNDTGLVYLTGTGDADFNVNLRGASGVALDSVLSTGETAGFVLMVTQGASSRNQVDVLVDGTTADPYWHEGRTGAPATSAISVLSFEVIKTGSAAFTVLENLTNFKK